MNTNLFRVAAAAAALALFAGACSDDSDDSSSEDTEAVTPAPEESTSDDEAMEDEGMEMGTIVDVAVADGRFTTLVAAVEAAGLVETLSGEGPFTVFAPTDDAFALLPEGTVEGLLEDPEALADILTYHVVAGEVDAAAVSELDGQSVETVNGDVLVVGVTDTGVTLTDSSGNTVNVIITDVMADNGIIHVIDAVLLPAA